MFDQKTSCININFWQQMDGTVHVNKIFQVYYGTGWQTLFVEWHIFVKQTNKYLFVCLLAWREWVSGLPGLVPGSGALGCSDCDCLLFSLMAMGTPSAVWGVEAGLLVVLWMVGWATNDPTADALSIRAACRLLWTNMVCVRLTQSSHLHTHTPHIRILACLDVNGFNSV